EKAHGRSRAEWSALRRWSARRDHPRMSRNPAGTWTPTFPCPAGRTARRGAAIERQSPHGHPPVQVRLLRRTSRARGVTEAYAPCKRVAAVRIRAGPFGATAGFLRPSLAESGSVVGGPSSLTSHRPFSVAAWSRSRIRFLQKIEAPVQLGELPSRHGGRKGYPVEYSTHFRGDDECEAHGRGQEGIGPASGPPHSPGVSVHEGRTPRAAHRGRVGEARRDHRAGEGGFPPAPREGDSADHRLLRRHGSDLLEGYRSHLVWPEAEAMSVLCDTSFLFAA